MGRSVRDGEHAASVLGPRMLRVNRLLVENRCKISESLLSPGMVG
jgi:hypothetical protein